MLCRYQRHHPLRRLHAVIVGQDRRRRPGPSSARTPSDAFPWKPPNDIQPPIIANPPAASAPTRPALAVRFGSGLSRQRVGRQEEAVRRCVRDRPPRPSGESSSTVNGKLQRDLVVRHEVDLDARAGEPLDERVQRHSDVPRLVGCKPLEVGVDLEHTPPPSAPSPDGPWRSSLTPIGDGVLARSLHINV